MQQRVVQCLDHLPLARDDDPRLPFPNGVIHPLELFMGIPLEAPFSFLLRHGPSCNCSSGFGMWKLWLRKLLQGKWQGIKLRHPPSHRKKVPSDMASISGGMKEWKAMVILSDFKN